MNAGRECHAALQLAILDAQQDAGGLTPQQIDGLLVPAPESRPDAHRLGRRRAAPARALGERAAQRSYHERTEVSFGEGHLQCHVLEDLRLDDQPLADDAQRPLTGPDDA
jgi:hypothetical protein